MQLSSYSPSIGPLQFYLECQHNSIMILQDLAKIFCGYVYINTSVS